MCCGNDKHQAGTGMARTSTHSPVTSADRRYNTHGVGHRQLYVQIVGGLVLHHEAEVGRGLAAALPGVVVSGALLM